MIAFIRITNGDFSDEYRMSPICFKTAVQIKITCKIINSHHMRCPRGHFSFIFWLLVDLNKNCMWTGNRFFVCMLIWCRISLRIQWANFYSDRTTFSPSNRHFTKNSQNDEICSLFNPSLRKTLAIPNMKSMFPIQVGSKQLHYRSNF